MWKRNFNVFFVESNFKALAVFASNCSLLTGFGFYSGFNNQCTVTKLVEAKRFDRFRDVGFKHCPKFKPIVEQNLFLN
jgi:hypothetical protein